MSGCCLTRAISLRLRLLSTAVILHRVESLTPPPFWSIQYLSIAGNRWDHWSNEDLRVAKSAYEDSRRTGPGNLFSVKLFVMGRQRCSLDVYRAPLFTREPLDPLTHRAQPLWSRDNTIMSYPWRAQEAEHASHRANHLLPGSWLAKAHSCQCI